MALLPTPQSGRLLRWAADGSLENVTISDLLDEIASVAQPDPATNRYWIDTGAVSGVSIVASGASAALAATAPFVAAGTVNVSITQPGASMEAVAGTASVSTVTSIEVSPPAGNATASATAPAVAGSEASGIAIRGTATYQSRTTSGSLTVTLPSGVAENDIIVIWVSEATLGTLDSGAISGYTRKAQSDQFGSLFYKRAGSSESNPSISSYTGSAICAAFSGCTTSGDPFDTAITTTPVGVSTTQALTGVTTSTDGALVMAYGYGIDSGWDDTENTGPNDGLNFANTTSGFCSTRATDGDWGPYSTVYRLASGLWYATKSTAGATGTTTVTLNVTEAWPGYSVGTGIGGACIALKPA